MKRRFWQNSMSGLAWSATATAQDARERKSRDRLRRDQGGAARGGGYLTNAATGSRGRDHKFRRTFTFARSRSALHHERELSLRSHAGDGRRGHAGYALTHRSPWGWRAERREEGVGRASTSSAGRDQSSRAAIENCPSQAATSATWPAQPTGPGRPPGAGRMRRGAAERLYGAVIDGADSRDNFFGEFFGSLETKNFTIPLEAVQEFQVVTNGFAPEFGRSTGGLLNVVTKSGTNSFSGSAHYFYRGKDLTKDDAIGTPPNIDNQHQFGAAVGGPIKKDKQFFFLAFDVQRQTGRSSPVRRDVSGVGAPEFGIADLADLEGPHTQFQNLFTILGRTTCSSAPTTASASAASIPTTRPTASPAAAARTRSRPTSATPRGSRTRGTTPSSPGTRSCPGGRPSTS